MKRATVRELRNRYSDLLKWIEAGEEIAISRRGVVIARLVPERARKRQRVNWTKSAAFRLDRSSMPPLSTSQSAGLLAESKGEF
jgi:prevent-host-death family protein